MTISDLKLKIFRQFDALEKSRLEKFYGVLMNYINEQKNLDEWGKLTKEQQQGLLDSIEVKCLLTIVNGKFSMNSDLIKTEFSI